MTRTDNPAPPAAVLPDWVTRLYDRAELIADGSVHVIGAFAAVAATAILVFLAASRAEPATIASVSIYAACLIAVIGTSAVYNMWPISPTKWLLRRFDHAAIYLLIAGTYTPFLIHLGSAMALTTLGIVWAVAALGAVLKLAAPGRLDRFAIGLYLVLGWSGVALAHEVFPSLSVPASVLLVTGGVLYTLGVVFHVWQRLRFQNAIWHAFVLAAAGCHYASILSGVVLARG